MEGGGPSVMTSGMILMLKWFADSWDWGKISVICVLKQGLENVCMSVTHKYYFNLFKFVHFKIIIECSII